MTKAYILLGGNLGDRVASLEAARTAIARQAGQILQASSVYETAAWGNENQPDFLNQVLEIVTVLPPPALLELLLWIEQSMGRTRNQKNDPRGIDLDILLYGLQVIDLPQLQVPHPRLQYRRFVLEPLAEIIPAYVHPVLQQNIAQLLAACTDPLNVKKFSLQ